MGVGIVIFATAIFGCAFAVLLQTKWKHRLLSAIFVSLLVSVLVSYIAVPNLYSDLEALPRLLAMISLPIAIIATVAAGIRKLLARKVMQ